MASNREEEEVLKDGKKGIETLRGKLYNAITVGE